MAEIETRIDIKESDKTIERIARGEEEMIDFKKFVQELG